MHDCLLLFALVLSFVSVSDPTHLVVEDGCYVRTSTRNKVRTLLEYTYLSRYAAAAPADAEPGREQHMTQLNFNGQPCWASSLLPGAPRLVD